MLTEQTVRLTSDAAHTGRGLCVWPVKRAFRHALYQLTKSNFPPNFSSHRDAVGSRFFRFRLAQFGSYFPDHFSIPRFIVSLLFRVTPWIKLETNSEDCKVTAFEGVLISQMKYPFIQFCENINCFYIFCAVWGFICELSAKANSSNIQEAMLFANGVQPTTVTSAPYWVTLPRCIYGERIRLGVVKKT